MIFNKGQNISDELLKQPWRVFYSDCIEYYTYIELAKLVNDQRVSLSTRVTRRESDAFGLPIGELVEFTPVYFAKIKEKIAPPHTKNSHVRSFFRVEETKEVTLEFSDQVKQSFILKTFGAGGASFKSKELVQAKHLVELNACFKAPNFKPLDGESFEAKGTLLDFHFSKGDYIYTFEFKDLDSKKKVKTDQKCFEYAYENAVY